ncbi:MAG: alpha/beta hydrolase [Candidatus Omnitrophica bacterium]|nr:alpha/beta hydrolase [Candidatus Omnitrophota bacterium]
MISRKPNQFKYVERRKRESMALIPGWATDYRIFDSLDLDFNYLVPVGFSPDSFEEDLIEALKEHNIKNLSLFGYSLGGFLASRFASRYPALIDELILVGIRVKYNKEELDMVRASLRRSKKGYLYKFYAQSFVKEEEMRYFKKNLLRYYLEEMDLDYLLRTLDYLGTCEFKPEELREVRKIKIVHARDDKIAPIEEAFRIKAELPQAEMITLKDGGHSPWIKRL